MVELDTDTHIQVLRVHRAPLDLLDLLFPSTGSEGMRISPGIILPLKETKVIGAHQGYLAYQVSHQTLTFTLSRMS